MSAASKDLYGDDYDEFGFLEDTAKEYGVPWRGAPKIARREIEISPGETMSYLAWGESAPEIVFLHGGGQNAHTWDTVALALGRPALTFDLLGHGHSSRREDRDYSPWTNADALSVAIPKLAPDAKAIVGMSLGGATTIRLAGTYPQVVRKAVIVDVTPQVNDPARQWTREQRGTVALIADNETYPSFEAMADAAVKLSPFRSAQSVRRGVRHNSKKLADGRWGWRYDLGGGSARTVRDFTKLWDDVSRIRAPAMLVLGGESIFVRKEDVEEMRRLQPGLRVETVPGAGHAVQSDRPLDLVRLIEDFVFGK
jgi:pimeloyl-ACP methyl ester carboxylesterase